MTGAVSEPDSREKSAEKALLLLENTELRKQLAELLAFYFADATDIIHWAASENEGVRQEALENEIFSCFHHIARGFCSGDPNVAKTELDKGRKTHLKRLVHDAFKIIIANHLSDCNAAVRTIDYIVLNEDYKDFNPDGFRECLEAQQLARSIKRLFKKAKDLEARGIDDAEKLYREALNECSELEEKLIAFKDDAAFKVCIAKFTREEREKKELRDSQEADRRENRKWRRITLVVSVLAICASVFAALK